MLGSGAYRVSLHPHMFSYCISKFFYYGWQEVPYLRFVQVYIRPFFFSVRRRIRKNFSFFLLNYSVYYNIALQIEQLPQRRYVFSALLSDKKRLRSFLLQQYLYQLAQHFSDMGIDMEAIATSALIQIRYSRWPIVPLLEGGTYSEWRQFTPFIHYGTALFRYFITRVRHYNEILFVGHSLNLPVWPYPYFARPRKWKSFKSEL